MVLIQYKFKIINAIACSTLKESKRQSWQDYISKINSRTPLSRKWNMIQKTKGKGTTSSIHHLKNGDRLLTDTSDIAYTLGETFAEYSFLSVYLNPKNTKK